MYDNTCHWFPKQLVLTHKEGYLMDAKLRVQRTLFVVLLNFCKKRCVNQWNTRNQYKLNSWNFVSYIVAEINDSIVILRKNATFQKCMSKKTAH